MTAKRYRTDKSDQTLAKEVDTEKPLDVTEANELKNDVKVYGNGDMFQLLCKASSKNECWMKSTKAMEIPDVGCVVQVTTQNHGYVAEALTFVPGVKIINCESGGKRLVPSTYLMHK